MGTSDLNADPLARELRERISAIDRSLVEAVNERLEVVARLWRHKESLGVGSLDRKREAQLRADLARLNPGPLSGEGLEELLTAILDLTKRELGRRVERD